VFSRYALSFPRVVGAASAAGLALASINLFGSFMLTYWPLRRGLPPLAPWVLLYALAIGAWNDNHTSRPAGAVNAARPLPADALAAWRGAHGGAPDAGVFIVAAEGGGIRAAYWTAAVLEELKAQLPGFERRLFAISGVSGGWPMPGPCPPRPFSGWRPARCCCRACRGAARRSCRRAR